MKTLRFTTFVLLILITCRVSYAAESPAGCTELEKDSERLACYDAIFRQETHEEAATRSASTTKNDVGFGEEQVKRRKSGKSPSGTSQPRTLAVTVTKLGRGPRKELLFYLSNGQLWKQQGDRYIQVEKGETVTLRKGRLGGYTLVTARGMSTKIIRLN